MNRRLITLAVVGLLSSLLTSWVAASSNQPSKAQTISATLPRIEYAMSCDEGQQDDDALFLFAGPGVGPSKPPALEKYKFGAPEIQMLNAHSREGWELVAVTRNALSTSNGQCFYLKRIRR